MSIASSLITDWIKEDLKWKYLYQPTVGPFAVPPGKVQIPQADYVFEYPEGTLIWMITAFNSIFGGMSMQAEPHLDFGDLNTIANSIGQGATAPNNLTYCLIPPTTPAGMFVLVSVKEWPWEDWCKLFLINTSPAPITCFGYGYQMAVLEEKRPPRKE